ncbi:MAG: HAD family phosphatase [Candidatus Marinimicrobia bacterium]|jgi:FMN phosphatase YigB (HAD superfamily)|nr:HAD family phosphatase [Candidatus Neomarinimicrobiota bacterium]MBT3631176.1 HAD family phosphatase [Candidatus Neomarinimicrobiota bacterium]MBT3824684.1 HAD family phosphatase [Candidatus Neomarinimicrobiota bacterium]MBT4131608.1 HAD family phosphatase [Candidatus Neomarinimicrobiota bacterium]MBT4296077.1 HAD family phosphatase [Candidatus Neomarinimicrobiota bacterium]
MNPHQIIKTIFFDIGGVLVKVDSSDSIQKLSRKLGVSTEKIRQGMTRELLNDYEKGYLTSNQFYEQLLINYDSKHTMDMETFKGFWLDVLFPCTESMAFLERVTKDFPVWLLSNTNDFHYDLLMQDFPFMKCVEGGTYSFMVGSMKPEPLIYEIAIKKSGFRPEEILFIDDLEANVQAAQNQGINTIHYVDFSSFSQELSQRFPELGYLL